MNTNTSRFALRALALAGLMAAGLGAVPVAALAGECPADKVTANGQKPGPMAPKDVTDTVIGAIDLAKEPVGINDRQFRLRKLVVQPGGIVGWHSHADRPAIIYIISGSITEYSSTCKDPIVHKAGDVSREMHQTQHWWQNTGTVPVELLSADLLRDTKDQHTM
jgi:quercetin dioxygenase-like cupin family protein